MKKELTRIASYTDVCPIKSARVLTLWRYYTYTMLEMYGRSAYREGQHTVFSPELFFDDFG